MNITTLTDIETTDLLKGKRKMPKKFRPHWEVMSDDSFNKTLKLIIIILYAYAIFEVAKELLS